MALRYYTNAPATTLAVSCSNAATSISVASVTGLPVSYPYTLVLDRGSATEEVVEVSAAAGTVLTVTRGVDSTTAFSHSAGAQVVHGFSARDFREPNSHVNASTDVHGLTGGAAVVGTTQTQTLTNKTLTTPTIASFANATHNHADAAGGGQITDAALSSAVTVAKGGTGLATLTASRFLVGNGTSAVDLNKVVPSGTVVGTSDSQTLTNKTVDLASNTLTGTKAQFNTALSDADFASLAGTETLTNKTLSTGTLVGGATTDVSGAWTSFTSTPGGGLTIGNGTIVAKYMQIGKTVHFRIHVILGTTSSISSNITLTVPVTPISGADQAASAWVVDISAGATGRLSAAGFIPDGSAAMQVWGPTGSFTSTVPFTWASTDEIGVTGTYEAA